MDTLYTTIRKLKKINSFIVKKKKKIRLKKNEIEDSTVASRRVLESEMAAGRRAR